MMDKDEKVKSILKNSALKELHTLSIIYKAPSF
jgi:hypothetical protein